MDKMGAILAGDRIRRLTEWQPIETAPIGTRVLLWFISSRPDNKYAHASVIGSVCGGEDLGKWWDGAVGEYNSLELISHWMPLPEPPKGE